jgi:hypothetical protein
MKKYEVHFWFGLHSPNPFITPSKVVEVEVDEGTDKDGVILSGLQQIGTYPRTYSASVFPVVKKGG